MKKRFVPVAVLVLFLLGIYSTLSVFLLVQENAHLKKKDMNNIKALQQNKAHIVSLQKKTQEQLKQSIDELIIKENTSASVSSRLDTIHIFATETPESKNAKSIAFWVKGSEEGQFDAMDLELALSNIKASPVCITGDAFSLYPLVESAKHTIHATGVASINMDKIMTGNINRLFISCIFEKKEASVSAIVELNAEKTHIYFLGKPVLDLEKSFTKAVW